MERSRRFLLAAVGAVLVILAVFLGGYLPGWSRARRAAAEAEEIGARLQAAEALVERTRFELEIARLRGVLGDVIQEANANNFGLAAERATAFFDGLAAVLNDQRLDSPERRAVLEALMARRDEISADFARPEPAVKNKLAEMYVRMGAAVQR